ncbi:hypothetical protein LTR85_009031 [Meristemomyces frigidus]|nr:hypothetical protein LTR85_009031 [Meristemomyces frigidus]
MHCVVPFQGILANGMAGTITEQPFRLLDLPGEIRNLIFQILTTITNRQGKPVLLDGAKFRLYSQMVNINATLASREMRHDYLTILYSGKEVAEQGYRDWARMPLVLYGKFMLHHDPSQRVSSYNTPGRAGIFTMHLPPLKVCSMMKRLQLVLTVPGAGGKFDRASEGDKAFYYDGHVEWLYPVRELKALGFHGLDTLEITVRFCNRIDRRVTANGDLIDPRPRLEAWIMQQADGIVIDAKEVTWVYQMSD